MITESAEKKGLHKTKNIAAGLEYVAGSMRSRICSLYISLPNDKSSKQEVLKLYGAFVMGGIHVEWCTLLKDYSEDEI